MKTSNCTRRQLIQATLGLVATGAAPFAYAQSTKVIRFILPVATGSGVDTITRTVSPTLGINLGANVIVENQPGAGGILGTHNLVKAAPDGLTLAVVSNNHVIYPSVYKSVPFDSINDITPIAVMGTTPLVLVVNPARVSAKTSKELIEQIKSKPGQYNYASSGNGTILHLAGEMFFDEAGVTAKHVPYKGVGPMVTDLVGGHVEIGVLALPSVQGHLKSGALRAIGVAASSRLQAAPEIPTFVEQGLPGYVMEGWFAVIAPAKLPAAEVARIRQALVVSFEAPEVKAAMAKQGNAINISTPEAAGQFFRSELLKYAKLVKKAGIELQ
jgi:tripartite-type tricarboxylate transporter receptor subunit TctC